MGVISFSMLLLSSSMPMYRISAATVSPAMYSYRACPNGWSASAGRAAILKPKRLMMPDAASDRLFTASAVTATLPQSVPMASFAAKSRRLQTMPTVPARLP